MYTCATNQPIDGCLSRARRPAALLKLIHSDKTNRPVLATHVPSIQCCYTSEGILLVDPSTGGGTVDRKSDVSSHVEEDVEPFKWCCDGGEDTASWLCQLCMFAMGEGYIIVLMVACWQEDRPVHIANEEFYAIIEYTLHQNRLSILETLP